LIRFYGRVSWIPRDKTKKTGLEQTRKESVIQPYILLVKGRQPKTRYVNIPSREKKRGNNHHVLPKCSHLLAAPPLPPLGSPLTRDKLPRLIDLYLDILIPPCRPHNRSWNLPCHKLVFGGFALRTVAPKYQYSTLIYTCARLSLQSQS
jgi:hypothetical protein